MSDKTNDRPTGRLLARKVREAVNATERTICGTGAVHSAAVADGLAWTGRRAARLNDDRSDATPLAATIEAPWIDHRVRSERIALSDAYAYELMAADGQQAIDHCLVAHRITAQLGRPGLCTIDGALADRIELVRLPDPAWIEALPPTGRVTHEEVSIERLHDAAQAAFRAVAAQTGRPLEAAAELELDEARFVLFAVGSAQTRARSIVAALRRAGIPCGMLAPALLRPFPAERIRERLATAENVVVLTDGASGLAALLSRRIGAPLGGSVRVGAVDLSGPDGDRVGERLTELFGRELPDIATAGRADGDPFVIGGQPGTRRVERLLLDSVAWLGRLATPVLDSRFAADDGLLRVTVGAGDGEQRLLDLLVLTRPEALHGTAPLERVRECGRLLLVAGTEDAAQAWSRLSTEQREVVVRRRLELRLLAPDLVERGAVEAAILAAAPGIGRTVKHESDLLDALARTELTDTDRMSLEVGCRGLVHVDTARLPEPAESPAEPGPPRMPIEDRTAEAGQWHESLRRFHFGSTTAEPVATAGSSASLRPAALDALEPASVGSASLFDVWTEVVLDDRRRRRTELLDEVGALTERLREMLGLPVSGDGAEALSARLGEIGAAFVDATMLEQRLAEKRRPDISAGSRRERLLGALAELEAFGERCLSGPAAFAIRSTSGASIDAPDDVELMSHEDGLRAALGLFDGLSQTSVAFARALRIARLEVGGRFDETLHTPALAGLDWQSLTSEELFATPSIVVLETGRHLRGPALAAFSELIRAGRPIHVLVEEPVAEEDGGRETGYHPGLGYLAVAHREALVVQSSPVRPAHLTAALARMVQTREPAVFLAAAPSRELPAGDAEQLEIALHGRSIPCFVYDPAGGTTWAERFDLEANPQPDRVWPVHVLPFVDDEGREQTMEQAFTYAHAVAADPAWRRHFRIIGPEAWLDDQVEIAEFLELSNRERAKRVPFLWIVENDTLARAIVDWELTFACRDRARAWRILQELAGTDNAYARRAAEEARQTAIIEADRGIEQAEADFAIALESAGSRGAATAIERLVGLLADPQGMQAALAAAQSGTVPPIVLAAATAVAEPVAEPAPAVVPAAVAPSKPYIDSFLCTTCNDCTNLNPRLFRYNADKQAEIADPAQGTFKELVKAAEVCPARCIHPGVPREGDKTATPALIERAAKFN